MFVCSNCKNSSRPDPLCFSWCALAYLYCVAYCKTSRSTKKQLAVGFYCMWSYGFPGETFPIGRIFKIIVEKGLQVFHLQGFSWSWVVNSCENIHETQKSFTITLKIDWFFSSNYLLWHFSGFNVPFFL